MKKNILIAFLLGIIFGAVVKAQVSPTTISWDPDIKSTSDPAIPFIQVGYRSDGVQVWQALDSSSGMRGAAASKNYSQFSAQSVVPKVSGSVIAVP